jgi:hypothetical protein
VEEKNFTSSLNIFPEAFCREWGKTEETPPNIATTKEYLLIYRGPDFLAGV